MSLDELTEKITKWGNDKGILDSDRNLFYIKNWNDPPAVWSLVNGKKRLSYAEKAYAQLQKTKEEVRELEEELEMLLSTSNSNKIKKYSDYYKGINGLLCKQLVKINFKEDFQFLNLEDNLP